MPRRDLDIERLKSLYAAADDMHDPASLPGAGRTACAPAAASRSATSSISAPNTPRPMGATVMGPDGAEVPVEMGSYGIGVSRLVGALIEAFHDEKGIIWPESVAPFRIGLVNLRPDDGPTTALAEDLYAPAAGIGRGGAASTTARSVPASSSPPWS